MKINKGLNYCILKNDITESFVNSFNIPVIQDCCFKEFMEKLNVLSSKQVMFSNLFYNFKDEEIVEVMRVFERKGISFINVTSNIEEVRYADKIIIVDGKNMHECDMKNLIEHEKTLKKIGFCLPFSIELSNLLKCYDVLDKVYVDRSALARVLWN